MRLERADAAAGLHREPDLARDALDDLDVAGHAVARAVEVDDVDPLGALLGELARLGDRVLVVDGHALVVALGEAHRSPAEDVDCGKDDHRALLLDDAAEVREQRAAPRSRTSRGGTARRRRCRDCTAAAKRTPYSVEPMITRSSRGTSR